MQISVQTEFLDVLQQSAASAVHDALGDAGGAAGVEDIQRVIERYLGEFGLAAGLVEVLPQSNFGLRMEVVGFGLGVGVGHHNQLFE